MGPSDAGYGQEANGVDEQLRDMTNATMLTSLPGLEGLDAIPVFITNVMSAEHGGLHGSPPASAACQALVNASYD